MKCEGKTMKKVLTTIMLLSLAGGALADNNLIRAKANEIGLQEVEISDSPLAGIKTVIAQQGIMYMSEDGKYILQGNLYELTDRGPVDLSGKLLFSKVENLKDEMIIYPAKNEKYVVTVFMDITCHYCHLLFEQVKEYNEKGITLRFLAFPRNGTESKTAQQMEAIWTAKDRNLALNDAENGKLPSELKTANLVKKHYNLGVQYGVRGTPSIVLPNGELLGGYLKPDALLEVLQEQ